MQHSYFFWLWIGFAVVLAVSIVYGILRTVSSLYWKAVICLAPALLSAVVVGQAMARYNAGEGGFKLGVDLVGGTILVFGIGPDREPENFNPEQLAAALKRRIDPADLYNVTIRPVGDMRVEIILPTGGAFQAQQAEKAWKEVLQLVEEHFKDKLGDEELDVGRGQPDEVKAQVYERIAKREWTKLVDAIKVQYPKLKEIKKDDKKDEKKDEKKEDKGIDGIPVGQLHQLQAEVEKVINPTVKPTDQEKRALEDFIAANYQPTKIEEIEDFVKKTYGAGRQRKDVTGE